MQGIRMMAGLLTVLIGSSMSESAAQGLGATQQSNQVSEPYLFLDGLLAGQLETVVQTQRAAGFDMKLTFAPPLMSPLFYATWMGPALQGQKPFKTVRLTRLDRARHVLSSEEATGIAPNQINFPVLNAASREPLHFSLSYSVPGLHPAPLTAPPVVNSHPVMLASNFRLSFLGNPLLDASHVSKIEAISVSPKGGVPVMVGAAPKSQAVGSKSLAPEIKNMTGSGGVAISNLVFYLAQSNALPFQHWLANSPTQTRNGSITYLKPNMTPWGTLALNGLTITKITTETNPGHEGILGVKVEMAVSSLQLTLAP